MTATLKTLGGLILLSLTLVSHAQEQAQSTDGSQMSREEVLKKIPPSPDKDNYIEIGVMPTKAGPIQLVVIKSSIRFNEDHRATAYTIRNLLEPREAEGKKFVSMLSGSEFDCTDPGVNRTVSTEFFPNYYAQGAGFEARKKNGPWERASENSVADAIGKLVCQIASHNEHVPKLASKIRANVVIPSGVKGNPSGTFRITRQANGEVVDVALVKSTGSQELDKAIEAGIRKSSPLPVPENVTKTEEFNLTYVPFNKPPTN